MILVFSNFFHPTWSIGLSGPLSTPFCLVFLSLACASWSLPISSLLHFQLFLWAAPSFTSPIWNRIWPMVLCQCWGSSIGAVVRVSTSQQCGLGSNQKDCSSRLDIVTDLTSMCYTLYSDFEYLIQKTLLKIFPHQCGSALS